MSDLLSHFGLKTYPFDKDIKSSAAMETAPFKETLARLDYIKRRGGIMLLTGDPGVGKTIALRRFVDSLNDNLFKPLYTPLTTLRGADLLRHLNDKLGLSNRASKAVVYRQIQQEILESREQRGLTLLMIIDEAHLLQTSSFHELRLLTNFKMDSFDPFVLIICGQSELKRLMEYSVMEPLAQRIQIRYHITPLDPTETASYVNHLMKLAGAMEPIFKDDALTALYELSLGIPRRIGSIAEKALTAAMFSNKHCVDADFVLKAKLEG